jgi:nitrite reductase (NO-forming)
MTTYELDRDLDLRVDEIPVDEGAPELDIDIDFDLEVDVEPEAPPPVRTPGPRRILPAIVVGWVVVVVAIVGGTMMLGSRYSRDSAVEALHVRTVDVRLGVFEITPDVIEVESQTDLTFVVENVDETQHDLTISPQLTTGRLKEGETASLRAGVVTRDFVIWCSIKGHREQGMEAIVRVKD